jgi:glutamyl-tRNA synthetase
MHIGNARTALFNYLLAKGQQGTFLLRIEDTDKARSQASLADELMQDLNWLGIDWQEGPGIEGPHAPYWQSQRQEIYDVYYDKLVERRLVYPCFCSDEELALQRKIQISRGQPPRYSGVCYGLSDEQVQQKLDAGQKPTLRFHVPDDAEIVFEDLVKGRQVFSGQHIGDFIVRRADGSASFMFCNAIDDALMGVTTALRGDDHLTNTPRQILILQALGLPIPQYGHISMILGVDGAPLSKRNGSMSIGELREAGFLAEAVMNYLARLGHYYEQSCWLSEEELAEFFETKYLGKAPARFDDVQLLHWQKEAVMRMKEEYFWNWVGEATQALVPSDLQQAFYEAIQPNILFPKEAKLWAEILFAHMPLSEEALTGLRAAGKAYFEKAAELWPAPDFKTFTKELGNALHLKGKAIFEPLRFALTGQSHGPELAHLHKLLGDGAIQQRLQKALEICA